ncbi:MAG TPA: hypothetical protein VGJ73_04125 [Verrucomicrobiae bacterium]|jgi:hypothetical protein
MKLQIQSTISSVILCAVVQGFGAGLVMASQMAGLDSGQPNQPFTWAAFPTDEIGIADAEAGTEITPSGSLYTGYGELSFMTGNPARYVDQPTRTLTGGDLPIIHYEFQDGKVNYQATMFSWALNPQIPDRDPVNYIRVLAQNTSTELQTDYFTVSFSYCVTNSHRFRRPVVPAMPGRYSQPGVEFDPHWNYGFQSESGYDLGWRSNQVVYLLPTQPQPQLWLTAGQPYRDPASPQVTESTPVLLAQYQLILKPGEKRELDFKMPVRPIPLSDSKSLKQLEQGDLDDALGAAKSWWQTQLNSGLQLHVGEEKVDQTFRASLMYLMLARERVGERSEDRRAENLYVQTVNLAQYHAFWLRDGSHMVHAYDLTGHSRNAAEALSFFAKFQKSDGEFLSQPGEHDGWGEALWAYGQHFQLTGDRKFARSVFPRVQRAIAWLEQARSADPLHMLPGGAPHDDELPDGWGHLTGDNFYALDGLQEAILMARALGHDDLATEWQAQYLGYYFDLFQLLGELAKTNGGYIPACLDTNAYDWGNLLTMYPDELLSPMDPLVTGTLNHALAHYGEGLMCYGPNSVLHQYLTMNNTQAWIARGQQQPALRELYSILVHTSSTQAGWECGPPPWTSRDFGNDLAPHNWFAADYIALVRNMLVCERSDSFGDSLDLLSVLSPAWSKPGQCLWVTNAPTEYGPINFMATFTAQGMELHLDEHFRKAPDHLRLHLPWFVKANRVLVDGKPVAWSGREIVFRPGAHSVVVDWQPVDSDLSSWSYEANVQRFKDEWRKREKSASAANL